MTQVTCISPVDGSLLAARDCLSPADAQAAFARARAAQKDWAKLPLSTRRDLVLAAVGNLRAGDAEATRELALMMGRPVVHGGEFRGVAERADHMAAIAPESLAPLVAEASPGLLRQVERVPHGVVFVIAPWNYPYLTAINTIVPALIAGNAVILKHAAQTLLAGERLERAFRATGLPEGIFANLFLDHATVLSLISGGEADFVNFTGSVEAGRAIERAAAGTFTGLGLELGGKDPAYVMEDADPARAAAALMDGAFYNSGQCCCGIERIYVARGVFDAFVEAAVEVARGLRLGDPRDPATTLGPMAQARLAGEVRRQIAEARAAGARALLPEAGEGAYLGAQILTDVNHGMRVMTEETFGPVVGIMPVASDAEALGLMNDSRYGLTASLWGGDADRADRLAAVLDCGTVFQNRCDHLDPALCWTGVKETGRGGTLSAIGYHNLTRPRSLHLRRSL